MPSGCCEYLLYHLYHLKAGPAARQRHDGHRGTGFTLTRSDSASRRPSASHPNALKTCKTQGAADQARPLEATMSDVDDFLAEVHPRLIAELKRSTTATPNRD
jgi:hypothetical protein